MVGGKASSSTALVLTGGAGAAAVTGAVLSRSGGTVLVAAALLGVAFAVLVVNDIVGALAVFIVLSFVEQIPGAGSGVTVVKGVGALIALAWVFGLLRRRWTLAPLLGPQLAFASPSWSGPQTPRCGHPTVTWRCRRPRVSRRACCCRS
jgi:hypothetical protein